MLATVLLVLLLVTAVNAYPDDQHESCREWAVEGECVNNPTFLWQNCQTSCSETEDSDVSCAERAHAGECSLNPRQVALRCPKSCGKPLSWNPYMRRKLDIPSLPADDVYLHCDSITSLLQASFIMHEKLKTFFFGGYEIKNLGFALDAPSDYLGMLGLAEAILYTFRMYAIIIDTSGKPDLINAHRARIDELLAILGRGYDADPLMRVMMPLMRSLYESQKVVKVLYGAHSDLFSSIENICSMHLDPPLSALLTSGLVPAQKITASVNQKAVTPTVKLLNKVAMPVLGLGTWQLQGADCERAVYEAIDIGYRHIDTAEAYRNEIDVGRAIARAIADKKVKREELFIATKLSDEHNAGYEQVKLKVETQLRDLQLSYIDLYMLHSPIANKEKQQQTWKALVELYKKGKIRALGVSNFSGEDLKALMKASDVHPTVIQNKFDIYHQGKQLDNRGDDIVAFAKEKGIVMVAYSSFSAYPFTMIPAHDPIVRAVAMRQPKRTTNTQVLLRWTLQRGGMAVIPRSSSRERLEENFQVLRMDPLSDEDMALLNSLQYLVSSPVSIAV